MKHVKIFLLVTALVVLSSSIVYADGAKVGILSLAKMTAEDFSKAAAVVATKFVVWEVNENKGDAPQSFRYYDNMSAMLLALEAGEIDEIMLTRPVAEYLTAQNPSLKVSAVTGMAEGLGYSFGFLNNEKGKALREKFNEALSLIKQVGRMDKLHAKYLVNSGAKAPEAAKFPLFPDGETIKVAVTGDLPPLDYTAADGRAAGYNTAILAEIGKHLGCNIELLQVDSAARVPALTSGRADVVFWFNVTSSGEQADLTSDVIISAPYYEADLLFKVRKK